ncbi:MAG: type II toxin-antitoxin system RelE/ParE family toxin [Aridibacter famidurans]|nr:type II toxin-antitoxin system RelE/ParE family toxin [Aridibacter famidurans]
MAKLLTFVETEVFRKSLDRQCSLSTLFAIQADLLENPARGSVIRRTGGLRKARIADARGNKGKSGGLRYIYLYLEKSGTIYLLHLFPKSMKVDLSDKDRSELSDLAASIKRTRKQ